MNFHVDEQTIQDLELFKNSSHQKSKDRLGIIIVKNEGILDILNDISK